jgi:CheY-like chemotaxis protein/PAS domain-containing protein
MMSIDGTPDERLALLERRLRRAEAARLEAESLLERRSRELERSNRELRQRENELVTHLDIGNRNLLEAQRLAGMATFYGIRGDSFRASPTMAALFGRGDGDVPNIVEVAAAIHPLDRDRIIAIQGAFFSQSLPGAEMSHECRIIRPNGEVRWLRWFARRDVGEAGVPGPISGTVQDITDQRRSDRRTRALRLVSERNLNRLRRTETALADRVGELERAAAALAASHARTDAAQRAKSHFLAQMSHNIRTPMNGVLGMMAALAQTGLDSSQADMLARARRAGDELRALVDNIIDIADAGASGDTAPAAENRSTQPLIEAEIRVNGRQPRILVAEDIETNQIVICSMLDTLGCDYVVVGNGALAVEAVQREVFDAVLMDIQMPVMDGTAATRAIRSLAGDTAHLPIIGITAQAVISEREILKAAGMDLCLAKPISVAMLSMALHEVLPAEVMLDGAVFDNAINALPVSRRPALIDQIARDLAALTTDLTAAVADDDPEAVRRARHSFDGIAGNFGAVALADWLGASRATAVPLAAALPRLEAIVAATVGEARKRLQTR